MLRQAAQAALFVCLVPDSSPALAEGVDLRVYALYRSSAAIPDARIYIVTFDADMKAFDGSEADYNRENCQIAASLFREQSGVKVLYWCEPGRATDALGSRVTC